MVKSVIDVYSEIAKNNPPWKPSEEKAFIATCTNAKGKWKSSVDKDRFVNEAMKHNLGLVFSIVNKVAFSKRNEDVFQKAVLGMVEALKKYDPGKGHNISTWINNPIRWAIMQHQNAYAKSGTIAEEFAALSHKFNIKMSVVSIDMPFAGDDENESISSEISIENVSKNYAVGSRFRSIDEIHMEADIVNGFHQVVGKLPKYLNEKEVLVVDGLLQGKTQTDISVEMKLSKVRISQIKASAFAKIRSSPMAGYLRKLLK